MGERAMRLIVHAGLHKTGSTYLQHVMNDNHAALLRAGVYYERQAGYPAHHFAAWDILRGDTAPIARMAAAARAHDCHTLILSSEDLEGAIFDQAAAEAIEARAWAEGIDRIEWHFCLRDPGETFASLYSQLQHHVFADPTQLFYDGLREGMIMILDPLRGQPGTPYWCFCLDQMRYLQGFAERTGHSIHVHDFRDMTPYPGWRILEAAGALGAIERLPGEEAKNSRLTDAAIRDGYCEQLLSILDSDQHRARLTPLVRDLSRRNLKAVRDYAEVISERFRASTAEALNAFGYRSPDSLSAAA
jgi:hypothetical protein